MARNLGLVLGGGGGKGAYQIGVLKALQQYDITGQVKALAGSSVGALNGVMLMQGDLGVAEEAWLNISPSQVLGYDTASVLLASGYQQLPSSVKAAFRTPLRKSVFSHKGLRELLERYVNAQRVASSSIKGYATCCCIWPPTASAEYFPLNDVSPDRLQKTMLATSAIPLIFEDVEIDGKKYCDGGIVDNAPVKPVYDEGCDVIVVVHLDYVLKDYSKFDGARIVHIIPSVHLGNVLDGLLDFSKENARWRMDTGYRDALMVIDEITQALSLPA